MYDLVIRNGLVIDPAQGLSEKRDLAIQAGRIVSVAPEIAPDAAWDSLDASGHLVTPGLIDIHVHVYPGVSHYGVSPDATCLARGVTTVCDAGSAGADTFDGLRRYVIDVSETRVLAFLNISAIGMVSPLDNELEDLRHASPERAIGVVERHRDVIQGIKARLSRPNVGQQRPGAAPARPPRRGGRGAADHGPRGRHSIAARGHPGGAAPRRPRDALLPRPGARHPGRPRGRAAGGDGGGPQGDHLRRGARRRQLQLRVARSALAQGLAPATISSDLHHYNVNGPVFDLATTMSKFLLLGLPLHEVLAKTTSVPSRLLGLDDRLGAIREGYLADITVFRLAEGEFEFEDSMKQRVIGRQKLEPVAVIRRGRIYRSELRVQRRIGHRY